MNMIMNTLQQKCYFENHRVEQYVGPRTTDGSTSLNALVEGKLVTIGGT